MLDVWCDGGVPVEKYVSSFFTLGDALSIFPTLGEAVFISESEDRKNSAKSSSALMVDRLVGMKGAAGAERIL